MNNQKLPHFTDDQQQFIKECLAQNMTLIAVRDEFLEMYPEFSVDADEEKLKKDVYQRIQKIKERHAEEIESLRDDADDSKKENMPYLSPLWRARYLRRLLRQVPDEDMDRQIKIIRELRSEAKLIEDIPSRKKAKIDTDEAAADEEERSEPSDEELYAELKKDPAFAELDEKFGDLEREAVRLKNSGLPEEERNAKLKELAEVIENEDARAEALWWLGVQPLEIKLN